MVDARDGLISPLDSASILGNHVDTGEVCQFRCGARGVEAASRKAQDFETRIETTEGKVVHGRIHGRIHQWHWGLGES